MQDNQLDAIVAPGASAHGLLAIGGYPAVSVPAGYAANGVPFAIGCGGWKDRSRSLLRYHLSRHRK
jgi:amidase